MSSLQKLTVWAEVLIVASFTRAKCAYCTLVQYLVIGV